MSVHEHEQLHKNTVCMCIHVCACTVEDELLVRNCLCDKFLIHPHTLNIHVRVFNPHYTVLTTKIVNISK